MSSTVASAVAFSAFFFFFLAARRDVDEASKFCTHSRQQLHTAKS